jgi:hypothetical protein
MRKFPAFVGAAIFCLALTVATVIVLARSIKIYLIKIQNNMKLSFCNMQICRIAPAIVCILCITSSLKAQWSMNGTTQYYNGGGIGIGTNNAWASSLYISINNNDGGTTLAPSVSIKNTNPSDPNGNGYNVAWTDYVAGNGNILGQCVANYGTATFAPFNGGSGFYLTTRTDHPIIFATGSNCTEKMRLNTNGHLAIGTTADNGNPLQVNGNVWATGMMIGTTTPKEKLTIEGNALADKFRLNQPSTPGDGAGIFAPDFNSPAFGIYTANNERLRVFAAGNVAIGTTVDNGNLLQVNGNVSANGLVLPTGAGAGKVLTSDGSGNATWQTATGGSGSGWALGGNTAVDPSATFVGTIDNSVMAFRTNNVERMRIDGTTGNISIGTPDAHGFALAVNGQAIFTKVKVQQYGSWPDYVFQKEYHLPSLVELEKFINEHRHLPGIASEAEVREKGIDVGDQEATLLKKVEELTLYLIQENNRLTEQVTQMEEKDARLTKQEQINRDQNIKIEAQQKQIDELKAMILENKKVCNHR